VLLEGDDLHKKICLIFAKMMLAPNISAATSSHASKTGEYWAEEMKRPKFPSTTEKFYHNKHF